MKPFRNMTRKTILISLMIGILGLVAVSSSLAYMAAKTGMQTNNFYPGIADIEISEPNGSSYAISSNTVNKVVAITNIKRDNAIPVYVRVKLVPVMRYANGAGTEGTGEKAEVTYNIDTVHWTDSINGYYYYKGILQPDAKTENLMTEAKVKDGIPSGRNLEIQVIADSIQTVANAEKDAWGVSYNNGNWQ